MKIRVLLLVAILGGTMARPARATTLVRMSLEQLSQASTAILRGHVLSQESRWNDRHTQIVTLTMVAVDQAVKGHPPSTVVIEQLGGTVGNIRSRVAGTVHFYPQADYLLFLEPAGTDISKFLVVGMRQGAFRIYRDATTQEERVIRPFSGVYDGSQAGQGSLAVSAQTLPFSQFRQQLSTALSGPMVIPRGASIPLAIESTESRGTGRIRVLGRTTADVFPTSTLVIPANSPVQGTGQLVSGVWRIRWTELSIRGLRADIIATSEEPRAETLKGRLMIIKVR